MTICGWARTSIISEMGHTLDPNRFFFINLKYQPNSTLSPLLLLSNVWQKGGEADARGFFLRDTSWTDVFT